MEFFEEHNLEEKDNLIKILDKRLENLFEGRVIDIGELNLEFAVFLRDFYEKDYNIFGPVKDKNCPGAYAIGISLVNNSRKNCKSNSEIYELGLSALNKARYN